MRSNGLNQHPAPGIQKVLGAFLLDAGLFGVFWFVGMIFTTAIWVLSVYIANAGTIPNSQPAPFASMMIGVAAFYLSILALWAIRGRPLSVKPTQMTAQPSVLLAISSGLGLCLLIMLCAYLLNLLGLDLRPGNQAILEDAAKSTPLMLAIFTVMIAPIFEELLFRKQIFARFQKEGYVVTAYILSSLLFAFMHEPRPTQGLVKWGMMLLLYAFIGALFAWVYQKTGRHWPAILAHASNNLLAIGVIFLT